MQHSFLTRVHAADRGESLNGFMVFTKRGADCRVTGCTLSDCKHWHCLACTDCEFCERASTDGGRNATLKHLAKQLKAYLA